MFEVELIIIINLQMSNNQHNQDTGSNHNIDLIRSKPGREGDADHNGSMNNTAINDHQF